MKAVYYATLVLGTAALFGLATMPLWNPHAPVALVHPLSQTADAAFDDGSPIPTIDDSRYDDVQYGVLDGSSQPRTAESQAYIDEHGYGYAPCMDYGNCDYSGGSLKDDPSYYSDGGGEGYGGYYDTYGGYDEYTYGISDYYYPSYGQRTGSYVASGLSHVPMILANTFSPQTTSWYPSYTSNTSYVPVQQQGTQMYTYAQPMQSGTPYQQSQQFNTTYSYSSGGSNYVPPPQTTQPSVVQVSSPVTISGTQTVTQPVVIAQPTYTTEAGFFAQPQQIQVVVTSAQGQRGISGTVSGPALPTCSISAKPLRIAAGATSTITWKTTDAHTISLSPLGTVGAIGSSTVKMSTTTTFTLTALGDTGTTTCSVKVVIDPTMCLPGCPPGYVCTPVSNGGTSAPAAAQQSTTTQKKSGFWSWFGL